MPGPCADVRETERLQDLADGTLMVVDAEAFEEEEQEGKEGKEGTEEGSKGEGGDGEV